MSRGPSLRQLEQAGLGEPFKDHLVIAPQGHPDGAGVILQQVQRLGGGRGVVLAINGDEHRRDARRFEGENRVGDHDCSRIVEGEPLDSGGLSAVDALWSLADDRTILRAFEMNNQSFARAGRRARAGALATTS
jgi:hypothetical protein